MRSSLPIKTPIVLTLSALFLFILAVGCVLVPEESTTDIGDTLATNTPEATQSEAQSSQQATVKSVDAEAGLLTLTTTDGETLVVNVDQSTEITVNGASATLEELQAGDKVEVKVNQETETATAIAVEGQQDTAQASQQATVQSVDAGAGLLTLALESGETMTVNVNQSTEITVNGASATLEELQAGDKVEVKVNQETETATAISVEAEQTTSVGEITELDLLSQTATVKTQDDRVLHLRFLVLEGDTQVMVEGGQGSLLDLAKGTSVEITYNPETMVVTRVHVRTETTSGLEVAGESFTVEKGGSFEGNVLSNDHNPDGGSLVLTMEPVVAPAHGSLTLEEDGTFSYTHDGGEATSDSFAYEACEDGDPSNCSGAKVDITIKAEKKSGQEY